MCGSWKSAFRVSFLPPAGNGGVRSPLIFSFYLWPVWDKSTHSERGFSNPLNPTCFSSHSAQDQPSRVNPQEGRRHPKCSPPGLKPSVRRWKAGATPHRDAAIMKQIASKSKSAKWLCLIRSYPLPCGWQRLLVLTLNQCGFSTFMLSISHRFDKRINTRFLFEMNNTWLCGVPLKSGGFNLC